MWDQEFDIVCDTLRSNSDIIKMIVECHALLSETNLLKRPEHPCARTWREQIEACPQTIALFDVIIDTLPEPTSTPSELGDRKAEEEGPSESLEAAIEALKGVTGKANQDAVSKAVELIEKAKGWYDQPSRSAATA